MQFDRIKWGISLYILVFCCIVLSGRTSWGTSLQQRQKDAVILRGDQIPDLVYSNLYNIRVYRYILAADSFQAVPFQVDERDREHNDYFDQYARNGELDNQDELIFMAKDLGDQALSDQVWPDDEESKQHPRYEIRVTDPFTTETGYVYIFISSTLAKSPLRYISYRNDSFTGNSYHIGHNKITGSGLPDTLYVLPSAGGDGINILGKHRLRIWTRVDLPSPLDDFDLKLTDKCSFQKTIKLFGAKVAEIKIDVGQDGVDSLSGPVRVVRSNILRVDWSADGNAFGNGSGNFPIRLGYLYYPEYFETPYSSVTLDLAKFLEFLSNAKAGLKSSSVMFTMMLNPNGLNMRYYTPRVTDPVNRQRGFKIDGINEGYISNDQLQPGEWPGQHWFGYVADGIGSPSVVTKATVYTHMTLQGNQPTNGPEEVIFKEVPELESGVWGDSGLKLFQQSSLPANLMLTSNFKYYVFPSNLTYNELQAFYQVHSVPMSIDNYRQINDHTAPAEIADLTILRVTDSSVTISWTAVGDDGHNSRPAKAYDIRYHSVPPGDDIPAWWAAASNVSPLPVPASPGKKEEMTLMNLEVNKPYYIGARAVDEAGNKSNLSSRSIIPGVPTPVELASFRSNIQQGKVYLDWLTSSESNNLGFSLERRFGENGIWFSIAFLRGAGTTDSPQTYSYVDEPGTIGQIYYRLKQIDTDGHSTYSQQMSAFIAAPQSFMLAQNYPNPFNPSTTIDYQISDDIPMDVQLLIYDLLGRQVRTLVHQPSKAGYYQAVWDGKDDDGRVVGSGVYIVILLAGDQHITRKMIKVQ